MWTCNKCNSKDVLGGKLSPISNSDAFELLCSKCMQPERLNPEDINKFNCVICQGIINHKDENSSCDGCSGCMLHSDND